MLQLHRPVVDWTRTDLKWFLPSTGYALRFDAIDFAAYDLFLLQRKDAELGIRGNALPPRASDTRRCLRPVATNWNHDHCGSAGAEGSYSRETIRELLVQYQGVSAGDLRANSDRFFTGDPAGCRGCGRPACHSSRRSALALFGFRESFPTAADARAILSGVDVRENGLTFCVGSYGARADNDLLAMVQEFASRIHFVHLRQVMREDDGSFYEARTSAGQLRHDRGDSCPAGGGIAPSPRKPSGLRDSYASDHGHLLADDISRKVNPGYSLVGRLKGLAELRGAIQGLKYGRPELAH